MSHIPERLLTEREYAAGEAGWRAIADPFPVWHFEL
jgi:hypothetical protein